MASHSPIQSHSPVADCCHARYQVFIGSTLGFTVLPKTRQQTLLAVDLFELPTLQSLHSGTYIFVVVFLCFRVLYGSMNGHYFLTAVT